MSIIDSGTAVGKSSHPAWLLNLFPFLRWLNRVNPSSLRSDAMAGFVGAIVMVPQGVAFATIAGMPPEYGLYAGMVPAIIAALWGSSWHLVSGPTTAASIVLYSSLSALAVPGSAEYIALVLTLTFIVGVSQLLMGLAKLGALVNFISHSVIVGFTAGAAILIACNQLKHFFGLAMPNGLSFYETLMTLTERFGEINPYATFVGALSIFVGLSVKRFLKKIPYMILMIIAGSLAAFMLNYFFGVIQTKIITIDAFPAGLPPLSSPTFDWSTIRNLAPIVLATTLFALVEAVSIARSLALKSGQTIDGNQEFIGQGLSNIFGSFFSGFVATGSFNRSGLNYEAGAKTPLAAVIAGILLLVVVLFVGPYASLLPNTVMAAVLFLVAWGLIDFEQIRHILSHSRSDAIVLIATFLATLLLELEFAILLGVLLSLAMYLNRTSRPKVSVRVPNPQSPNRKFVSDRSLPECPQLTIIRVDGSLFFGSVNHVREVMTSFEQSNPDSVNLLLLAQGINFVDLAGAEFLQAEAKRRRNNGGHLLLYRLKQGVVNDLNGAGVFNDIGSENLFYSKHEALKTLINERFDNNVCAHCEKRIFIECQKLPVANPSLSDIST